MSTQRTLASKIIIGIVVCLFLAGGYVVVRKIERNAEQQERAEKRRVEEAIRVASMPHPVVEDFECKGTYNFMEYAGLIEARIRNDGVAGYIKVTYTATQGVRKYEHSDRIFMEKQSSKVVSREFPEIDNSAWKGSVNADPEE